MRLAAVVPFVATGCASLGQKPAAGGAPRRGAPSAAAGGRSPAQTAPSTEPLVWGACDGANGPVGVDCATLQVPLDYSQPNGRAISIALDRHRASGTRIGSLLTDPGGPGVSGVDFLPDAVRILQTGSPLVVEHFDVIGFDPRGVDRSTPIRCVDGPQLDQFIGTDPSPAGPAGFQALVNASRAFDQGCQAKSGDLLAYVGTVNAARDMDRIRQAIGDPKLSYIGFSYGTLLGATYAELFPIRIRAMVLDGAIDPALDPIASNLSQAVAFDQELRSFFSWCATSSSCAWRPAGALHSAYDALLTKIRTSRLPASNGRTLGPGEAFYGVALALYDQSTWPDLAIALNLASAGDGSTLLQLSDLYTNRQKDGSYGNQLEANNAIDCVDQPWPRDPTVLFHDAARARHLAPEFGLADLLSGLTCSLWPVAPTGKPHAITAPGSPPIVVVGSTGDPATPYAGSQSLAGELQHGVLITRVGDGHTGYRSSGCVRRYVDDYLVNLTVPRAGLTCPTP